MDNTTLIVVVGVAVLVVVALALVLMRRRRSDALRARFGPEYDRAVVAAGKVGDAERMLEAREKRVAEFHLHPIPAEEAQRFTSSWKSVQARFVDDPRVAVLEADRLIGEAMHARGYPVGDFDRQVEDLSVEHARVLDHYRAGRAIVVRHEQGQASTEDLRQAMVHYRLLFEELLSRAAATVGRAS
jgi:hypothetical protein